jgi:catechol 2,3-dioxygenase-like lactoylglutathione lyase family enzyme
LVTQEAASTASGKVRIYEEFAMRKLIILATASACVAPADAQFAEFNDVGVTFGHVHIVIADMELHKKLWPELFDAELVEKEGYAAVRISDALIFFRDAEPTAPSMDTAMDHFGLQVRDIDDVLSKWRALGYDVDSESTDADGLSSASITMPGGVGLVLVENTDQAASTAMHHVHFATPKRGELMTWYSARFGAAQTAQLPVENALATPGAGLRFDHSDTDRLPTDGAAIDHIGFEIREWEGFIAKLEEDDVEFEFGPVHIESLDLWVAFFNDPSGVLVEITHGLDRF